MRVLFSSTAGYGHVFPMVPLARAVQDAGHAVCWATGPGSCPLVEAAGISAVPAGQDSAALAEGSQQVLAAAAGLPPHRLAGFVFPRMFGGLRAPAMLADLLPVAEAWQPDLIVHEQAELAGPVVAAVLGIPGVTHAFGGGVPADFVRDAGEQVAALWEEHHLPLPPFAGCYEHLYLDICPSSVQTVSLAHIGPGQPLRPVPYTGPEPEHLPVGVDRDDGRPLVYLTLGTVHDQTSVLQMALAALPPRSYRLLVTVGPHGDPTALGPQPTNVTVERFVSQTAVLPRCAAVVSHGGSGTFLAALGLGFPQVLLPQAADQFRNAEACSRRGAGVALGPADATADAVAAAVELVLSDPRYRTAARVVRDEITRMPNPEAVVTPLTALAGR